MTDPAISFRNVTRRFGDSDVLRGLSFQVERGQIYALLGRNGAGKTTAMRILLGRLEPHGGGTQLLGRDSLTLQPNDLARIGYVSEGHRLYRHLTVGETLRYEAGTRPNFDRAYARTTLDGLGIPLKKHVILLSRGQRAQLGLVLAVASRPELLICDDPALGLDAVMRRDFLDAMIGFLGREGTAVLFSSHILADVERVADRIGILNDGALMVDATLDDLKGRISKRGWVAANGAPPPASPQILRREQRDQSWDLTLLDADPALDAQLSAKGRLLEPSRLSLEELFLELTVNSDRPRLMPQSLASNPSPTGDNS